MKKKTVIKAAKKIAQTIKKIIIEIVLFVTTFLLCVFSAPPPSLSIVSPCKQYNLQVYTTMPFFAMPGGGGFSGRSARVILRNKWGKKIGQSNQECSLPYYSVDIEWDEAHQLVWYGRTKSIDLKTGECRC